MCPCFLHTNRFNWTRKAYEDKGLNFFFKTSQRWRNTVQIHIIITQTHSIAEMCCRNTLSETLPVTGQSSILPQRHKHSTRFGLVPAVISLDERYANGKPRVTFKHKSGWRAWPGDPDGLCFFPATDAWASSNRGPLVGLHLAPFSIDLCKHFLVKGKIRRKCSLQIRDCWMPAGIINPLEMSNIFPARTSYPLHEKIK